MSVGEVEGSPAGIQSANTLPSAAPVEVEEIGISVDLLLDRCMWKDSRTAHLHVRMLHAEAQAVGGGWGDQTGVELPSPLDGLDDLDSALVVAEVQDHERNLLLLVDPFHGEAVFGDAGADPVVAGHPEQITKPLAWHRDDGFLDCDDFHLLHTLLWMLDILKHNYYVFVNREK